MRESPRKNPGDLTGMTLVAAQDIFYISITVFGVG